MRRLRLTSIAVLVALVIVSLGGLPGASPAGDDSPSRIQYTEILVKFGPDADAASMTDLHRLNGCTVAGSVPGVDARLIRVPADRVAGALASYGASPIVEYAEPNSPTYVIGFPIDSPDDPYFDLQWALSRIKAQQAWAETTGSPGIRIAILDTGIDLDHVDLAGKIVANRNFSSSDTVEDLHSHGTHVAGIAAAITNNGIGVAGIGCDSSLMNVKVLGDSGAGSVGAAVNGIIWATNGPDGDPHTDDGAHVINMSFTSMVPSLALQEAIDYAWEHGVVLVGGAGNNSTVSPAYPARYPQCIAVAATRTDTNNCLVPCSNHGPWVEVAAPGEAIWSTYNNGDYGAKAGTSMASPHVAGLAALLRATVEDVNGNGLLNDEVKYAIESACTDVGIDVRYGLINAYQAVTADVPSLGFISGTLTDAVTGEPVCTTYGASVSDGTREAFSRSDGTYTIYGVPAGTYTITVSALGFTDTSQTVTVNAADTAIASFGLMPSPPGFIAGVVKDLLSGVRVAGATVTDGARQVTTLADGSYMLADVPAGNYTVTASAPGYLPTNKAAIVYSNQIASKDFSLWATSNTPPEPPANLLPADGANGLGLTVTLESSAFSDPDWGSSHIASQWQITAVAGDYSEPAFDSGTDRMNLIQITVPSGLLDFDTTYFWRVRHQDNHAAWSGWSAETSFSTLAGPDNLKPYEPGCPVPADWATDVPVDADLYWTGGDPDAGDTVSYDVYFGTSAAPPMVSGSQASCSYDPGALLYSTTYYWRVVASDSQGSQTEGPLWMFTVEAPPPPEADFEAELLGGYEQPIMGFTDRSTSYGGIVSWSWSFGDGGVSSQQNPQHTYAAAGSYIASLTVTDAEGRQDVATGQVEVPVPAITVTLTAGGLPIEGRWVYPYTADGLYAGGSRPTDASGQATFALSPGGYRFKSYYNYTSWWSPLVDFPGSTSIEIPAPTQVVVTVDGVPLVGYRVYPYTSDGSYAGSSAVTDASGVAEFRLVEGSYRFRVYCDGLYWWSDLTASSAGAVIDIPAGTEVMVTLGGTPLAGCRVYAYTAEGLYVCSRTADESGCARFTLKEGDYRFKAYYEGSYWQTATIAAPVVATIEIPAPTAVVVTVDGSPVQYCRVYAYTAEGSYSGSASTDACGEASFLLAAGNYKFRAYYGGAYWWSQTVDAPGSAAIEIAPATVVKVTVDGTVLEGCRVYAYTAEGAYVGSLSTDALGQASFSLKEGKYKFRVYYNGAYFWSEVVAAPDSVEVDVW